MCALVGIVFQDGGSQCIELSFKLRFVVFIKSGQVSFNHSISFFGMNDSFLSDSTPGILKNNFFADSLYDLNRTDSRIFTLVFRKTFVDGLWRHILTMDLFMFFTFFDESLQGTLHVYCHSFFICIFYFLGKSSCEDVSSQNKCLIRCGISACFSTFKNLLI